MIINWINGITIEATPAEVYELVTTDKPVTMPDLTQEPAPVETAVAVTTKTKTATKTQPTGKQIDWGKARALRNAGWSYEAIGEELGCSGVTVSAHLRGAL